MKLDNEPDRWGLVARTLHWTVAALVVTMLVLGWASELEEERDRSLMLIRTHFQFGVVLFGLMILRLTWRLARPVPAPPSAEPPWRTRAAGAVHAVLYLLLLTMPVSGYIIWIHMNAPMDVFGVLTLPRLFTPPVEDETLRAGAWYVHYFSGWILVSLVGLHLSSALWHRFVARDGVLRRMLG